MGEPAVSSVRSRWLILAMVAIVAGILITVVFWSGIFIPKKLEKVYFSSSEWSETVAHLYIANTGADSLVISKVWINGTRLDSSEWESFPSVRFEPGDQGVLQMTPSLITFKSGTTYEFTLETLAGNSFSSVVTASWQTMQAGAMLTKENVSWTTDQIQIVIRNSGTSDAQITAAYIGTSSANLTSANVSSPSLPANISRGSTLTITLTESWSSGTRYYFKIVTDSPVILEFSEMAP